LDVAVATVAVRILGESTCNKHRHKKVGELELHIESEVNDFGD
jgi:hypothetical protein